MCECGCGSIAPDVKLPGPDGTFYTITVDPGCKDCGTPVGVIIGRLSAADATEEYNRDLPDAKFNTLDEVCVVAMDPEVLKEAMLAWADENDPKGYLDVGEWADAMDDVFYETARKAHVVGQE